MISNQILQNTIEGLKGISRVDFCVLDTEGKELAATFEVSQERARSLMNSGWNTCCLPTVRPRMCI